MPSTTSSTSAERAELPAIEVKTASNIYQAVVGPGAIEVMPQYLDASVPQARIRVIADATVWESLGTPIEEGLRESGRDVAVLTMDGREEKKSINSAATLFDWLIRAGTDRGDVVVGVGGGVMGDLVGFVAATYLRGVRLVHVPTSLLAMVDSSIGGKVAVNHPLGKNLIGAFHQPILVVADTRALRTLPDRERANGWSEVIKIAMIRDGELFQTLSDRADEITSLRNERLVGDAIRRAVQLKGEVVGEDEREDGLRVILNYGHTIGHAIEAATAYGTYLHGEAVAIGMRGAASIAAARGVLPAEAFAAQTSLIAKFGLPDRVEGVAAADLLGPLSRDKKARGKTIQWVFADGIGSVTTRRDVTPEEVAGALETVGCR
ncbi:MAG: 3-dehydroquinate synthase [Chloroflexota bacterium]